MPCRSLSAPVLGLRFTRKARLLWFESMQRRAEGGSSPRAAAAGFEIVRDAGATSDWLTTCARGGRRFFIQRVFPDFSASLSAVASFQDPCCTFSNPGVIIRSPEMLPRGVVYNRVGSTGDDRETQITALSCCATFPRWLQAQGSIEDPMR